MGVCDLDLVEVSTLNITVQFMVVVKDPHYRNIVYNRMFTTFRQARTYYNFLLESEIGLSDRESIHQATQQFYKSLGSVE